MNFLADMGVSVRCVEWLRAKGHDAIHLCEQNLHRLPDSEVLKKAHFEKRILLTMDLDFAKILSSLEDANLPLTVIFRLCDQRPDNIQAAIESLLPILEQYEKQGSAILSVDDNKVRVRRLPIHN
jgi:predicted nuclease of predicted toxin-antitoxin system